MRFARITLPTLIAGTVMLLVLGPTALDLRAQVLIPNSHAEEAAELSAGPEISPGRMLRITISMALRNRAELERLVEQQRNPSSPLYHRWLTPDEFNDRFGPTADDLAMVEGWLTKSGFSVQLASMSQRKMVAEVPAAVAEKAFAVRIATTLDGLTYANLGDPVVPAAIAPLIGSIHGLGNTIRYKQEIVDAPATVPVSPQASISGHTAFGPKDLWTFYDETGLNSDGITGSGADCIALIEVSDVEDNSIATFDSTFGLPAINLTRTFADNSNPGTGSGSALREANLDVEYAHAIAPGAPINLYIGDDALSQQGNGLVDALARAVKDDSCGAISMSFAFCGAPDAFYQGTLDPLLVQAESQGQGVFISSGDEGAAGLRATAAGCVPGTRRGVSELAADPHVTAVGGTQFVPNFDPQGKATGYSAESVWKDRAPIPKSARGATGGGKSKIFAKPAFQSGAFPGSQLRVIPDVSFAASEVSPGFFFAEGGSIQCCIGGTSLSAPAWAGITALAAQRAGLTRIGNLNAALYTLGASGDVSASGLHDVVGGINSFNGVKGFKALSGYDRATGLGTPDIGILVPLLAR